MRVISINNEKLAPMVREIGWTHNLVIMEKCKDNLAREFSIRMTRKFGWTKNVLLHQIENQSYKRITETVAAFLNVEKGGTLLIGVDDDGAVVGIEYDYNKKFDNRKNRDVYENNLMTALLNACGKDCGTCIQISFGKVEGKDVCRITVSPSPRPVYIKDGQEEYFYIRAGNSSRALSVKEATEYIQNRWV